MRAGVMETKRDENSQEKDEAEGVKHCKLVAGDEAWRKPLDFSAKTNNDLAKFSLSWGENKLSVATRIGNKGHKLPFGETCKERKMEE